MTILRCDKCGSILGSIDEADDLVRLKKSSVAVQKSENRIEDQSFNPSIFICAQLLSLIESTSIRKIVCYCSNTTAESKNIETQPLVLWVFNPDIYFSCSTFNQSGLQGDTDPQNLDDPRGKKKMSNNNPASHSGYFRRAAKIFYRRLATLTSLSADDFLDQNTNAYEALPLLDLNDLAALQMTLESSNRVLPTSARRFQDWSVGLLERWE